MPVTLTKDGAYNALHMQEEGISSYFSMSNIASVHEIDDTHIQVKTIAGKEVWDFADIAARDAAILTIRESM